MPPAEGVLLCAVKALQVCVCGHGMEVDHEYSYSRCHMYTFNISRMKRFNSLLSRAWLVQVGAFLMWWPPSTIWAGPLIFYDHHRGCLNNPIFSNLGLCAVCWAHFMCHHKLWPASVGHPLSFLKSSWGLTGGKNYQKITIVIFRFVLQNFTISGNFPYILSYRCLFPLRLQVGFLLQYATLFQSGN